MPKVFTHLPTIEFRCSNHSHSHSCIKSITFNVLQTYFKNRSLSEFKCGSLIGCCLCNRSNRETPSLLNSPESAVSGIITKRKSQAINHEALCKVANFLQSQSLQTPKLHVDFRLAQQQCVGSFIEWVCMAKKPHESLTSPSSMQSIGCSNVKHVTTGL